MNNGVKIIEVRIGWTKSDRANGYSSFCDGYRPGAEQHTLDLEVTFSNPPMGPDGIDYQRTAEAVADACFTATNSPFPDMLQGISGQIYRLIRDSGYRGREAGHFSLSVGDTVTVGEVMLACEPLGWERVTA